jgi:hypothetical protein
MDKALRVSILVVSFLLGAVLVKPSFAIVPEVQNVIVYKDGDSTFLNITIFHYPEETTTPHYVDIIRVTVGGNTTELQIGVQPLTQQNTFVITYDLGPVSGTPTALVEAHCIVNGWSSKNWSGQVPEYSLPTLLLMLTLGTSLILAASRKVRHKSTSNLIC